jgi:hypothetical protein
MATFLLWASGIVMLIGIANFIWMLRESRVGIHPTCRHCGYDLRGIWRRILQCPECGGDVRMVARGQWKFDWRMVAGPVLLLLLGLSLGGVALGPRIHQALLTQRNTTLLAQTLSFDRKVAAAAFVELRLRRDAGELSSTEALLLVGRLADRARVERLVRTLPESARTLGEARSALKIWDQLIRLGVNAPKPAMDERYLSPLELKVLQEEPIWEPEPEPEPGLPKSPGPSNAANPQSPIVPDPVFKFVPGTAPSPKPPAPDSKPSGRLDPY